MVALKNFIIDEQKDNLDFIIFNRRKLFLHCFIGFSILELIISYLGLDIHKKIYSPINIQYQ